MAAYASLDVAMLEAVVADARANGAGAPAAYIPELAHAPLDATAVAVLGTDGQRYVAGDHGWQFTLQSSAKLLVLAGLLEERGPEFVFSVVGAEPTGGSFSSVAWLETHGPRPANPLVNAGAIALCAHLKGNLEDRVAWIEGWCERLYGRRLSVNSRVLASERRTGDRNRSIAFFLRGAGNIREPVEDVLESYFTLCSLEGSVGDACHLPAVLAAGGRIPGTDRRVLSPHTAASVVAIMATCGMYDESGAWLLEIGLPAKSGVSGVIVAVSPGTAGIAVASPRVNARGNSVRGHQMLRALSQRLGWHFALR